MTDVELTELCESYIGNSVADHLLFAKIYNDSDLKSHHIDLLLASDHWGDRYDVFTNLSELSPEHIEAGLNDDTQSIRQAAYVHPKCTDEQKVKFHLKWGYTDVR